MCVYVCIYVCVCVCVNEIKYKFRVRYIKVDAVLVAAVEIDYCWPRSSFLSSLVQQAFVPYPSSIEISLLIVQAYLDKSIWLLLELFDLSNK